MCGVYTRGEKGFPRYWALECEPISRRRTRVIIYYILYIQHLYRTSVLGMDEDYNFFFITKMERVPDFDVMRHCRIKDDVSSPCLSLTLSLSHTLLDSICSSASLDPYISAAERTPHLYPASVVY